MSRVLARLSADDNHLISIGSFTMPIQFAPLLNKDIAVAIIKQAQIVSRKKEKACLCTLFGQSTNTTIPDDTHFPNPYFLSPPGFPIARQVIFR